MPSLPMQQLGENHYGNVRLKSPTSSPCIRLGYTPIIKNFETCRQTFKVRAKLSTTVDICGSSLLCHVPTHQSSKPQLYPLSPKMDTMMVAS